MRDALAHSAFRLKCAVAASPCICHGVCVSRGPGRVMRRVLEVLEGGSLSAPMLALAVGASEGSTRRALRTLHARQEVVCLGFEWSGGQRWAIVGTSAVEDLALLWSADRVARLTHFMGLRFTRSVRRFLVTAL